MMLKTEHLRRILDKNFLRNVVLNNDTRTGKVFDLAVMTAIVVSILIVFVESLPAVAGHYKTALEVVEGILTLFFTIEYVMRVYASDRPKDYALSFFGIIDLLATLPPYLSLLFPAARYTLVFRSFRLIRVFRVFKLFAFINEGYLLLESIRKSLTKITVYFLFVLILVIALGTLMYMIEGGPNTQFRSIPDSIYWAIVTTTTVGYGDITPVTLLGKMFAGFMMILGYTIIAIPTGIVSATMIDMTQEKVKDGRCPRCHGKVDEDDVYCRHCAEKL